MVAAAGRKRILEKYGYRCAYCGCELTEKTLTLDHFIPHSRLRKQNKPSPWDNLLPCCQTCNMIKGNKDIRTVRMYYRQLVNGFLKRAGREELLARDFKFLFEDKEYLKKLPKARKAAITRNERNRRKAQRNAQIKKSLEDCTNSELLNEICRLKNKVISMKTKNVQKKRKASANNGKTAQQKQNKQNQQNKQNKQKQKQNGKNQQAKQQKNNQPAQK